MSNNRRPRQSPAARTSWDSVAEWYSGMVGEGGHKFHRRLAIPALLDLLAPQAGETLLDIGCGPAPLAPFIAEAGAQYTGIDASPQLLDAARQHHGPNGRFLLGDARKLWAIRGLSAGEFDAATFLLSIQDMDPLGEVFRAAAWALREGGRVVLLMTHPAFRIPRQSGWGFDDERKLVYRRVDRYLSPLAIPLRGGATRSFHRPLHEYINSLGNNGLLIDRMTEIDAYDEQEATNQSRADNLADREIPLFLALRARKVRG